VIARNDEVEHTVQLSRITIGEMSVKESLSGCRWRRLIGNAPSITLPRGWRLT